MQVSRGFGFVLTVIIVLFVSLLFTPSFTHALLPGQVVLKGAENCGLITSIGCGARNIQRGFNNDGTKIENQSLYSAYTKAYPDYFAPTSAPTPAAAQGPIPAVKDYSIYTGNPAPTIKDYSIYTGTVPNLQAKCSAQWADDASGYNACIRGGTSAANGLEEIVKPTVMKRVSAPEAPTGPEQLGYTPEQLQRLSNQPGAGKTSNPPCISAFGQNCPPASGDGGVNTRPDQATINSQSLCNQVYGKSGLDAYRDCLTHPDNYAPRPASGMKTCAAGDDPATCIPGARTESCGPGSDPSTCIPTGFGTSVIEENNRRANLINVQGDCEAKLDGWIFRNWTSAASQQKQIQDCTNKELINQGLGAPVEDRNPPQDASGNPDSYTPGPAFPAGSLGEFEYSVRPTSPCTFSGVLSFLCGGSTAQPTSPGFSAPSVVDRIKDFWSGPKPLPKPEAPRDYPDMNPTQQTYTPFPEQGNTTTFDENAPNQSSGFYENRYPTPDENSLDQTYPDGVGQDTSAYPVYPLQYGDQTVDNSDNAAWQYYQEVPQNQPINTAGTDNQPWWDPWGFFDFNSASKQPSHIFSGTLLNQMTETQSASAASPFLTFPSK